jgi:hypothetical protein
MPIEVALFLAFFVIVAGLIVTGGMIASRKQTAKQEELKRAASARGWLYETKREHGFRVDRWTGTTDGVSWSAESMQQTAGSKHRSRRYVQRWHGAWSPGINGAILAMGLPRGKEDLGTTVAAGDGFFARMAQKAVGFALDKAIDSYFGDGPGKEVDASALHRIETRTPGFVVMAADKDEGARISSQGLEQALADAAKDQSSILSNQDRPWILLQPKAISLARMRPFQDINELEAFVRAGVALTRAFKFGRRA